MGDHPGVLVFLNPYTAVAGGIAFYVLLPEEQKDAMNDAIISTYEEIKEKIKALGNSTKLSYTVVKSMIEKELQEKGIRAEVSTDINKENGNIMYTVSPIPEDMKFPRLLPLPLSEAKKPDILSSPLEQDFEKTLPSKKEEAEKAKRQQEKLKEMERNIGIPIPDEKPVTIYTISAEEAKEIYKDAQKRSKVVNLPKNLTKEQIENKKNKADSKILDEQLKISKVPKPDYDCAAHHLVSDKTMPNATKALNNYGIDINSAANGVYLPTSKADSSKVTTEAVHAGPNGREYKNTLEENIPDIVQDMKKINASYNEIQVALENELNNTRIKLLTGELKINNAKLKGTTKKGEIK